MGIATVHGFRTESGHLSEHLAHTAEAVSILRGLGLRAVALEPIAGTDVGVLAVSVNYESNADHAASIQRVQADSGWQEFWARTSAAGAAEPVESSVYSDLDPTFQPSDDRPLGVLLATQWRARPGRLGDFLDKVMESVAHVERMGGTSRTMQSIVGAHPLTTLAISTFSDLDAYGAYADTAATDAKWQEFWLKALSDPSADLIRSGVYVNISDA